MNNKPSKTKKKKRSSGKSIAVVLVISAVVIGAVFLLANTFSGKKGNENVSMRDNGGFPISFAGGIDNVGTTDSSIYVLGKNALTYVDLSGKKSRELILNYSDPQIKTSSNYALLYDKQGSSFSLYKKDKEIFSSQSSEGGQINTAAISNSGNFIIVSRTNRAASMLTYYDKDGKIIFQWLCADEYIVSAGISKKSNYIACAAINAVSGQITTHVYCFDVSSSENNRDYTFNDTSAVDCFFSEKKIVCVVCSNKRICINFGDDSVSPVQMIYSGDLYKRSNDEQGNSAIITRENDSFSNYTLTLYSSYNDIKLQKSISGIIKDVVCQRGKVYVLTDNGVIRADKSDEVLFNTSSGCNRIVSGSRRIYYFSPNVLNRH